MAYVKGIYTAVVSSTPEGVLFATVTKNGVDQAPAGELRRTVHPREASVRPGDITTPALNRQ